MGLQTIRRILKYTIDIAAKQLIVKPEKQVALKIYLSYWQLQCNLSGVHAVSSLFVIIA
jgi:hypothetical protein